MQPPVHRISVIHPAVDGSGLVHRAAWMDEYYGKSEVVQIAQRQSGDPVEATYDRYDASGNLIAVTQPTVLDGNPADSSYGKGRGKRPHGEWLRGAQNACTE